jgi:hypothetical protein
MTPADTDRGAETDRPARDAEGAVRSAAFEYVVHGWGIVPGSVWNGRSYTLGHCPTVTDGLVPAMVSGRTLRVAREVWSWWSIAPYAVLARAGEDFDVLVAPLDLVQTALQLEDSAVRSCPIVVTESSASLLIKTNSRLRYDLRNVRGVALAPPNSLIPLPPTVVQGEAVRWLIAPRDVGYRPGLAGAVQSVLATTAEAAKNDERS